MLEYYNTVPSYGVGGMIAKIAKAAGRAKIQAHANLLSKSNPELSKLLSKLAKTQKGGAKLTEEESQKLASLAQDFRRSNIKYKNRRQRINEQIEARRTPQNNPPQQPAQQPATPTQPQAPAQTNPVPGTTLSSRWKQAKTWMNNHPKTTIGVPLLAFGTGPGRYVTGNILSATQSNPKSWFGNEPAPSTEVQDFILINGRKIPIKRSAEGYFIPANQDVQQNTPNSNGTDVDNILSGISNENLGVSAPSQNNFQNIPDQQAINDLFVDEEWQ